MHPRVAVRDASAAHHGCEAVAAVLPRACRSFLSAPAVSSAEQLALDCSAQLLPVAPRSSRGGGRSESRSWLQRRPAPPPRGRPHSGSRSLSLLGGGGGE
ncbi:hypothetical protein AB1Y20_001807 [Prymnesium parvum]|uniref:Uncharacterized protein n=1 Tax=Prymnesium parvum TaxID=97485 RepID=A0AB34K9C3_PRYPA